MRTMAIAALAAALLGCNQSAAGGGGSSKLASQDDSVSYILGYKMGENLKQQSVPVKPDLIFKGLQAAMAGSPATIPDSVMQATMMGFQVRMMGIQHQKDSIASIENRKTADKFLTDNKGKDGVKSTPSGLQYKVLKEGTGAHPTASSTVTVNYAGTLLDGKEFDASARHGGPATFRLGEVIPGWIEGIQLMTKGAKYQFWIPGDLGYGAQGSPPNIPPNATLVFEVELLEIK